MKVDIISLQRNFANNVSNSQKSNPDFDLRLNSQALGTNSADSQKMVTSKFACTPGCGNTGTGNSYCCTC